MTSKFRLFVGVIYINFAFRKYKTTKRASNDQQHLEQNKKKDLEDVCFKTTN